MMAFDKIWISYLITALCMVVLAMNGILCDEERRLLLHSADDIAMEFHNLRQEIETLRASQSKESSMLKSNQSQEVAMLKSEIVMLKSNQSHEISSLQANYSQTLSMLHANQSQAISMLQAQYSQDIASLKTQLAERGSTYIRWGRTTCAGNNTVNVYSGYTAGSPDNQPGGAATTVCLPEHPTWAKYTDGLQNLGGYISGAEYQDYDKSFQPFPRPMLNNDAPCVLCHTPRSVSIMIPGRTDCYQGWTLEYTGYLMTGGYNEVGPTDYACVDAEPEAELHGEADQDGKRLYFTEVTCGSLPCQEYPNGRELACVVCSK